LRTCYLPGGKVGVALYIGFFGAARKRRHFSGQTLAYTRLPRHIQLKSNSQLYDRDFYARAPQQAGLLRDGRLSEVNIGRIAEEIESMSKTEKRELVSRLTILLLHLLKGQFQPSHRGAFWRASINNARDDIADHLEDNPSLKTHLDPHHTVRLPPRRPSGCRGNRLCRGPFSSHMPLVIRPDHRPGILACRPLASLSCRFGAVGP
jgi:hypothetical protein